MKELLIIQEKLKVGKNQINKFGKFKYRSCEDILEAVKPLLTELKLVLILTDKIINVGNYNYVEATAKLYKEDGTLIAENAASAREADDKKGMDDAQVSGSTSSYARKYALNGLFAIDDNKDADTNEYHEQSNKNNNNYNNQNYNNYNQPPTQPNNQIKEQADLLAFILEKNKRAFVEQAFGGTPLESLTLEQLKMAKNGIEQNLKAKSNQVANEYAQPTKNVVDFDSL